VCSHRHGDREYRFEQEPFPLYPGERLVGKMTPLTVVPDNAALLLRAERDIVVDGESRQAGEEWLITGPVTYMPRVDVSVVERIEARVVRPGQALKLQAKRDCRDKAYDQPRRTGEVWLMRLEGAYLASVNETVLELLNRVVLSEQQALHLRATANFTDIYGTPHQAGDHWLVTNRQAKWHIIDVYEEIVGVEELVTLTSRQFCVVANPIDAEGHHQLGTFETRRGPCNFFLQPPYEQLRTSCDHTRASERASAHTSILAVHTTSLTLLIVNRRTDPERLCATSEPSAPTASSRRLPRRDR